MKKIIFISILVFSSCAYKVKTSIKPLTVIESQKLDTTKIRYNGYYNKIVDTFVYSNGLRYDFPKSITNELIVFSKNKKIYINDNTATRDSSSFNCKYYKEIYTRLKLYNVDLPNFTVKNDSIYTFFDAIITVGGGQRVPVYCNYRGYVKNRDTIADWKVIPPYPKDFTKFVIEKNKDLFEPKTLYFVKTDAVKCLKIDEFK